MERAFLNWAFASYREAGLGDERGARSIEQLFDERAALSAAGAGSATAAAPNLSRLLPDPRDVGTSHALALELARAASTRKPSTSSRRCGRASGTGRTASASAASSSA